MRSFQGFTVYHVFYTALLAMRNTVKRNIFLLCSIIFLSGSNIVSAQSLTESSSQKGTHEKFEFDHPLYTESISPDTKIRVNYDYQSMVENVKTNTLTIGGEYAFSRIFSIETEFPYSAINTSGGGSSSHTGNWDISFKFANFEFQRYGVLLGYGIDFSLPTGNDQVGIGSNHIFEVAPFLDAGLKKGRWEWIAFSTFGIPTHQSAGENVTTELELNASSLYHVNQRLQALLELNESSTLSGQGEKTAVYLSPGIKVAPIRDEHLVIGVGTQIPVTANPQQKTNILGSVFYHF